MLQFDAVREYLMRYYPAALALSMLAGVTASVTYSASGQPMNPRAADLLAEGSRALAAGKTDAAIDAFEAALVLQPGAPAIFLQLAEATRRQGMQGKALHYYREALEDDPQNLKALSGEGAALVEKGAVDKARRNLTRLQGLCGDSCEATRELAAAIAKGPAPRMVTAEAIMPDPVASDN